MQTEHINKTTIQFDKQDIVEYNLSGGTYSANIDLKTMDGKSVNIKFDNNDDLRSFVEHLVHSVLKMDWTLNYPSDWHRVTEEVASVSDIAAWKAQFTAPVEEQETQTPW